MSNEKSKTFTFYSLIEKKTKEKFLQDIASGRRNDI